MHILAIVTCLFIISLYFVSAEAYFLLIVVFILFGGLLYKTKPKLMVLILLCPILAFLSLGLYESHDEIHELRVIKVYDHYVMAQKGFKRFNASGDTSYYSVGDLMLGEIKLEKIPRNASGYIGEITLSNPKRKQDGLTQFRRTRESLSHQVIDHYGFDRGSLMASLVLGYKEDLNRERKDAMKTMGIMHILSISGFHFALLEIALKRMKFGRFRFLVLGIYAVFVHSISGYRTLLTILYKIIGRLIKKDPDLITGTFFAMFIQAFFSPYLIFQTGYLLTYFSTLGILLFHEKISRALCNVPSLIRNSFSLTLAALSLSFPIILSFSPEFSLGVFAGNMILVPLYVITTYLSFLGVMVMNFPFFKFIVLPFIEVFFDLSYYMSTFLSDYSLQLSLENLFRYYAPILLSIVFLWKNKSIKRILIIVILIFMMEIPYGTALTIYNSYGTPYIRITQNFKNYDIMDYRVAEEHMISLRSDQEILLGEHMISLKLGEKKRDLPLISIDGKQLVLDQNVEYIRGLRQERKYFFVKEKIMRIK